VMRPAEWQLKLPAEGRGTGGGYDGISDFGVKLRYQPAS
jgi:hypothetical protein